jgi:plasmid stabilization system protein ParE
MDANPIITAETRDDLDEAYAWYEARRAGKGEDFLLRVNACISAICRTPEMHNVVFGNYRRALVRKFPYSMIYDYEDDAVTVYGVFHTSRDQENWRRRLP